MKTAPALSAIPQPPPPPAPPPIPPLAAPAAKHCPTCKRSFPADAPRFAMTMAPGSSVIAQLRPHLCRRHRRCHRRAPALASVSAPPLPPAQAPSAPAKKTTGRRVLIIVVAVIAMILGALQIMRGLHLISYKPSAKSLEEQAANDRNQVLGERVFLTNHGCSLRVPKGWERKDVGGGGHDV